MSYALKIHLYSSSKTVSCDDTSTELFIRKLTLYVHAIMDKKPSMARETISCTKPT